MQGAPQPFRSAKAWNVLSTSISLSAFDATTSRAPRSSGLGSNEIRLHRKPFNEFPTPTLPVAVFPWRSPNMQMRDFGGTGWGNESRPNDLRRFVQQARTSINLSVTAHQERNTEPKTRAGAERPRGFEPSLRDPPLPRRISRQPTKFGVG